jgi:hypothetical protein
MTLKAPSGEHMIPIACIPKDWHNPGGLVLQRPGGGYRTAYSIDELMKHNPSWLVESYLKSLHDNFLKWLDSQECLLNSKDLTYRWQHGDIPPFWFVEDSSTLSSPDYLVDPPEDTRQESDYLSYGDDEPVRRPKHTAKKKAR